MSPSVPTRPDVRALRELLERVVGGLGGDLEELNEQRAGSRRLLRLVVDRDGGVTLDDVAEISQAVSAALDASDVMGETPYVLEVTSPGVGRPLTAPRHWRRAAGRLVQVNLSDGGQLTGRVGESDEDGVVLDVDGTARRIEYVQIAKAKVQVEFNRSAAGGEQLGDDDTVEADDEVEDDDADGDAFDDDDADPRADGDDDTQARFAGADES